MDISNLVDYEKTFLLELVHPAEDYELGITVEIRSIGSAAAERVLLEHTDKQIGRFAKNKLPTAAAGKKAEIERTAACIKSWEWGINPKTKEQNKFQGEVPELSMKKAVEVCGVSWIEKQIREAAESEKNFTTS